MRADTRPAERLAGMTRDGRGIYVYRRYPVPVRIERFDLASGRLEPFAELQPLTAAVSGLVALFVTPDGAIFYTYSRTRSALYAIDGVK